MACLALAARAPAACSSVRRAPRSRAGTVRVAALFGNSADAERRKQEQWEAQQELLAERRAKREAIMVAFNRKEAREAGRQAKGGAQKTAPKRGKQPVVVEEEEEEAPAPSNPLSGLFGLFGKK